MQDFFDTIQTGHETETVNGKVVRISKYERKVRNISELRGNPSTGPGSVHANKESWESSVNATPSISLTPSELSIWFEYYFKNLLKSGRQVKCTKAGVDDFAEWIRGLGTDQILVPM